jgi:uncharacterized membrane protein YphA (DoxX/SURF4 family)
MVKRSNRLLAQLAALGAGRSAAKYAGARKAMNSLHWVAQILLAAVFLFTGATKVFSYEKLVKTLEARDKGRPVGVSRSLAFAIGVAEIAGAIGVILPFDFFPHHLIVRISAAGLALIMVLAGIYHIRRNQSAAPSVALFLLAVFVIVGRWPH